VVLAGSYYEIIGVESSAEVAEIKTAYRKLAKELHPDVNPSPEALQKFIEVTTAYVLSLHPTNHGYGEFKGSGRSCHLPYKSTAELMCY
jgi:DnaJ-class molecular chaperone